MDTADYKGSRALHDLCRSAWNALRNEHQPVYDELVDSYKEMLHARAQNVATLGYPTSEGGIFQTFEQNVVEALQPERFHPLSKQFNPTVEEDFIDEGEQSGVEKAKKKVAPKKAAAETPTKKPVKVIKKAKK